MIHCPCSPRPSEGIPQRKKCPRMGRRFDVQVWSMSQYYGTTSEVILVGQRDRWLTARVSYIAIVRCVESHNTPKFDSPISRMFTWYIVIPNAHTSLENVLED